MDTDDDRLRNQQGEFDDYIPPKAVLSVFDARDDRARPVTATDVCEEIGIARRTAHNKLNRLVERGTLETRKVGARGRVWWRPIPTDEQGTESKQQHEKPPQDTSDAEATETDTSESSQTRLGDGIDT